MSIPTARMEGEAEPIDSGRVTLRDGRSIVWTAWGAPNGVPVIAQPHIGVSGRRTLAKYIEPVANAGIRLIEISRAGLGGSTLYPAKTQMTDAHDTLQVADALGLDRLAIMAQCGGSAAAIALAARRPERVAILFLASPAAPLFGPGANGYLNARLRGMRRALRFGLIARSFARAQCRAYQRNPEEALDRGFRLLPSVDLAIMASDPALRALTRAGGDEFYGSPDLFLSEWRTIAGPWPLDWAAIRCPVVISHGALDQTFPVEMSKWLSEQIPGAELRIYPDKGHYLGPDTGSALLHELATRAAG